MNRLYIEDKKVIFKPATESIIAMPNLTALYTMYQTCEDEDVKTRIKDIFDRDFGKVLVAEIMIDMTSPQIIERLHTGDISKTLRHVDNYNVILESELEAVRESYEGDFEKACFAQFPYGMVVEEVNFEGFKNNNCEKTIL